MVAAITRTSTVRVLLLADALETVLLQHAQQLPLQSSGISPTSSRNSVPPSASSNRPTPSRSAPVNAPLAWPKNSLSNSSRGIAAQLTRISGRRRRGLASWIARAISSLPVPDSPVISTVASVGATSSTWRRIFWMAALRADDAVVIALDPDFLLQIGVLQLQPLAQPVDLLERGAQPLVGLAPLGDVAEHDHRADHAAAVADRRRGVFDPEGRAVLAPEHLGVDLMHRAVTEGGVDRAVVLGIVRCRPAGCDGRSSACRGRPARRPSSPACARPPD